VNCNKGFGLPKDLSTISYNITHMTELRKVREVGSSVTLTIPKSMGFVPEDWIKFEKRGNEIVMTKVDV